MSDNIRYQGFECGDPAALAGFLYDDCEPAERRAIEAHLVTCQACAGELASLQATREQLAAWTPPDVRLDFRIGAGHEREARTDAWWRRPLPAWAQLAAAAAIFAVGTAVGGARASGPPVVTAPAPASAATPAELARLEERVERRFEQRLAEVQRTAVTPAVRVDAGASLADVRQEINESEERMQQELALRVIKLADSMQQQINSQVQAASSNMRNETTGLLMATLQR